MEPAPSACHGRSRGATWANAEAGVLMATDGIDDQMFFAEQARHAEHARAKRFTARVREHEAAATAYGAELSDEAKRSVADFQRHVATLNDLVDAEIETLVPVRGPAFDFGSMAIDSAGLHVFGPDDYALHWVHLDLGQAGVDVANGRFHASNYTTGPARFTVAQLGVRFRPSVPVCKLSVRAYAQFSGYDILTHQVHQPGTSETRRAWALGSVGVKVDSVNLAGGDYHLDGESWVDLWNRSEINPSDSREYEGSVSVSDGLIVEPICIASREYAIWVTCRVGVSADPGFTVSTYATSSIGCHVPYFVVEEIEHW
jgi:hypothetical protein